jgi:hypothetical protein
MITACFKIGQKKEETRRSPPFLGFGLGIEDAFALHRCEYPCRRDDIR